MTAEALPEIDQPHIVEAEIVSMIVDMMVNHPRSLQTAIGPSEVGHPCARNLIHKLAGHTAPGGGDRWAAQIGTFVHAGLEQGVQDYQRKQNWAKPRYLTEHRVTVGTAAGVEITGSADIFDIDAGLVGDYKIVGPTPLLKYAAKGPGSQYRSQAHLYGRGFALQGYRVNTVMIIFLPRGGELGSAKFKPGTTEWVNRGKRYCWSEPYDEQVALAALTRLNGLYQLLQMLGPEAAIAGFPKCDEYFCPWCARRLW